MFQIHYTIGLNCNFNYSSTNIVPDIIKITPYRLDNGKYAHTVSLKFGAGPAAGRRRQEVVSVFLHD